MQQPLRIRKATPKDYDKLLPLFKQLYHGDIGPNLKQTFTKLTRNKENIMLVAEQNKELLGTLIANYYMDLDWEGKTAKLQAIIIDRKHRHKGIGKKLIQHFQTQAKNNKCKAITARVNRKSKDAQLFFHKLNFTQAETNEYALNLQLPKEIQQKHT